MSESAQRPSRAPEAVQKKPASRQVTRAAQRRATSQSTGCSAILAGCTATVTNEAKGFYRKSLTDEAAATEGQRHAPSKLLNEWITVSTTLSPWVHAGRVKGYGPMRFRYAAEVAAEIAARTQPADAQPAEPSPAASTADSAEIAALKLSVAQGLRNLGIAASSTSNGNQSPRAVSHTLEELATAVRRASSNVPAEVMADAGLTPAVVEALTTAAQSALASHTTKVTTRTEALANARREDVLLGRLVREMRLMMASARTSHRSDHEVPTPRSSLLTQRRRAQKSEDPPVPPAPPAPR